MENYSLIEKLAIVKSLDQIIAVNGKIEPGEEKMLRQIQEEMNFNHAFVEEARLLSHNESFEILKRMPLKRKKLFAELMHRVAIADGNIDEYETNLIIEIYRQAQIDIETFESNRPELDLSYIYFNSSRHYDYPSGLDGSRDCYDLSKSIKIEPVLFSPDEYSFIIYDGAKENALWGKEIASSPVKLKIVSNKDGLIKLNSEQFSGTEVEIYHDGPDILRIVFSSESPYKCHEFIN